MKNTLKKWDDNLEKIAIAIQQLTLVTGTQIDILDAEQFMAKIKKLKEENK